MITRKVFLAQMAGSGLALAGCGGGGSGGDGAGAAPQAATCTNFSFTGNHGHVLTIPIADLDSTTDKTYSIVGSAPHDHPMTLSVAQLRELKAGRAIQGTTGPGAGDGHTHDLSGSCA
jgi:hypothetical protein